MVCLYINLDFNWDILSTKSITDLEIETQSIEVELINPDFDVDKNYFK